MTREKVQLSLSPFNAFTINSEVSIADGVPVPVSTTVCGPVVVNVLIWLNEIPLTVFVVIQYGPIFVTLTVIATVLALVRAVSAKYFPDITAPVQFPPAPIVYTAMGGEVSGFVFLQAEKRKRENKISTKKFFIQEQAESIIF